MQRTGEDFAEVQRRYLDATWVERFRWATRAPGFAETEDALLLPLIGELASPCLEIGCGEGNNLVRIARNHRCFGVDLYPRKLAFAARQLPDVRFSAADAYALPFPDDTFASVFVRDLLHHVSKPQNVLREVVRVLAPRGRLCLLEPNGRSPIVRLQTWLVPAEAGARTSNPTSIASLLEELELRDVNVRTVQPLALRRMLYHYQFGLPSLGRIPPLRAGVAGIESLLGGLLPRSRWTCVLATANRA